MADDSGGELKPFNPAKQISEQITLYNLVKLNKAFILARTGNPILPSEKPNPILPSEKPLTFNERMQLRFKGLNEIISIEQTIADDARAVVKSNDTRNWGRKYKAEEEQSKNPFDEEDNDYNELMAIFDFLNECEQKVITARKTKKLDDDFIWEKEDYNGKIILELTPNFFNMLKDLSDSKEEIETILHYHKIISIGVSFDEELTEKELDEEVLRRIVES